ncbi:MAG: MotA/TolQ/ExbB proton channel family protein [Myxococcaceae bacterium]
MDFSLLEMWHAMGFSARIVVFILLFMSIYVVGVSIERWKFFKKGVKSNNLLVAALRELLQKEGGASLQKTRNLAKSHSDSSLATVVDAASEAFMKKSSHLDALDLFVGINRAVERSIERQTSVLKKGLGGLATIASTAPFVGLFGTVLGIINSFQSMSQTGSGGLSTVSAGISEALVVTAFGLLVAIPSVALYNYFTGLVDKLVVDMDEVASEMVEAVVLDSKKA